MIYYKEKCTEAEYKKAAEIFGWWNYKVLANNLKQWYIRVHKRNLPVILLVDGNSGQGKTTFSIKVMDFLNYLNGDDLVSLDIKEHPQIGMGATGFITSFNKCKRTGHTACLYTEAGDMSRRTALSKINRMIIRSIETFRSSKIIIIMDLPNMNVVDSKVFSYGVVRALFHLDHRETCNHGVYYCFSLNALLWIKWWFDKLPSAISYMCYKKTSWNFRGGFKDLDENRRNKLAALSDKGKSAESRKAELDARGLVSIRNINEATGVTAITIKRRLDKWKIAPIKEGRTFYYPKFVIEKIREDVR